MRPCKSYSLEAVKPILIIYRSTATTAINTAYNQANTALWPSVKFLSLQPARAEIPSFLLVQSMIARAMSRVKKNGSAFSYDELLLTSASFSDRVHKLKHSRLRVFRIICIAWISME
jgi:hypothetical protein